MIMIISTAGAGGSAAVSSPLSFTQPGCAVLIIHVRCRRSPLHSKEGIDFPASSMRPEQGGDNN